MAFFRKIKAGLVNHSIEEFIGEAGNIFFDIETGELRLSDGVTPGGIPLTGGGGGGALRVKHNGNYLGTATTLDFGNNLTVEVVAGTANIGVDAQGASVVILSNTAPINPQEGSLWYNPDSSNLFLYANGVWVVLVSPNMPQNAFEFDGGSPSTIYAIAPGIDLGAVV